MSGLDRFSREREYVADRDPRLQRQIRGKYQENQYALQEQGSNYSFCEGESALLQKIGLPSNPQELSFVDALHAMMYAAHSARIDPAVVYNEDTLAILREKRYGWRSDSRFERISPETALYLDAYARVHEFSNYLSSAYRNDQDEKEQKRKVLLKIQGGLQ